MLAREQIDESCLLLAAISELNSHLNIRVQSLPHKRIQAEHVPLQSQAPIGAALVFIVFGGRFNAFVVSAELLFALLLAVDLQRTLIGSLQAACG